MSQILQKTQKHGTTGVSFWKFILINFKNVKSNIRFQYTFNEEVERQGDSLPKCSADKRMFWVVILFSRITVEIQEWEREGVMKNIVLER